MLSIYIHIPYCVGKCLYCGFYSTPYLAQDADEFLSGLNVEAEYRQINLANRHIESIYIGGGTPTVLSLAQLAQLINIIKLYFPFDDHAEFTVEANPNTVTKNGLTFLLEQGVNRLSLGIQSFSAQALAGLGRLHTVEQATDAFRHARSAGFKNIGIDLIYGIPGQTKPQWQETVDAALALKPEHISAYSLSLDEGSQFMRLAKMKQFALPEDELTAEMYERAVSTLSRAGYQRYEVSNFSLPGFECRHNQNYWDRGEYLGLGPGASSFLAGKRYDNIADSVEYARRLSRGLSAIENEETVGGDSAAREVILLGLRTARGVDLVRFQREHGTEFLKRLETNVGCLEAAGLLLVTEGHLKLTDRGFLLSDAALTRLCV
jgi:oxygen-independent coproporphyrinogen-3 oxidase